MYASPAAAGGRIYFVGRDGTTVVIDARSMEVLGTNVLNDPIDASPAIVGNQLFLRSAHHVYCLQAE
jgi:outer membrane protein assembly factor BamB